MCNTVFQIENESAEQFEMLLEEWELMELVQNTIERDFRTEFYFEELNDEEYDLIESLINSCLRCSPKFRADASYI